MSQYNRPRYSNQDFNTYRNSNSNSKYRGPPPSAASSWYDTRPQPPKPVYIDPRPGSHLSTWAESDPAFVPEPRYHGKEDFIDFGKHAGMTFYEAVNEGHMSYVQWLKKGKFFDGWLLDPSCIPHVELAVKINPKKGHKWERKADEEKGEHWWECNMGDDVLCSPHIKNLQ